MTATVLNVIFCFFFEFTECFTAIIHLVWFFIFILLVLCVQWLIWLKKLTVNSKLIRDRIFEVCKYNGVACLLHTFTHSHTRVKVEKQQKHTDIISYLLETIKLRSPSQQRIEQIVVSLDYYFLVLSVVSVLNFTTNAGKVCKKVEYIQRSRREWECVCVVYLFSILSHFLLYNYSSLSFSRPQGFISIVLLSYMCNF